MIDPNQTLGEVATVHPGATVVFLRHHLDFCCGGAQKLGEACQAQGLAAEEVVAEIEAREARAEAGAVRWDERPIPELIDHILEHYHAPLRRDLPVLIETARKVERVHAEKASCPRGLTAHLEGIAAAVEEHLGKEETILFPALRAGGAGQPVHLPIRVLMQEHVDHGANLARTRELTADLVAPPEACATWRALYAELLTLEAELMRHIHLENNILFPRALVG